MIHIFLPLAINLTNQRYCLSAALHAGKPMHTFVCTVLRVVHTLRADSLHRYRKLAALIDTKQETINYRSICHVGKKSHCTSCAHNRRVAS